MTPDRSNDQTPDDAENGVLADSGSLDTSGFGILDGNTAQVDVTFAVAADDDDYIDDEAVDDDVSPEVLAEYGLDAVDPEDFHIDEVDVVATEDITVIDEAERPADVQPEGEMPDGSVEEPPADAGEEIAEEIAPMADTTDDQPGDVPAEARPAEDAAPATSVVPAVAPARHPERIRPRTSELALAPRRHGEREAAAGRETADLLTPDRLLDPHRVVRPEPEGAWQHFVYRVSGHRINLGDGRAARERKALDQRIAAQLSGGAKFVPVLSRKGGVGKTTVTTLLGMALADARDDRVIAVDANPDRGTLADRISRASGKTVRDLVRRAGEFSGYADVSAVVARDETRLDVLASDRDPQVSEAFSDSDYAEVARIAAHYYSLVLTDTGTGIVHSVMGTTLELADELVIVAGLSVDEARLASETLTWLETNGHADLVRNAVVVINTARPGAALVRADQVEAHFRTRVRAVVRMPYDPHIAAGSAISFRDLRPETRKAARELAAIVVEGLRSLAPAA